VSFEIVRNEKVVIIYHALLNRGFFFCCIWCNCVQNAKDFSDSPCII